MKKTFTRGVCAALLVSAAHGADASPQLPATAATNEVVDLPPVVVEASRLGLEAGRIPAHVEVIGRHEIAESGARDVVDLLEKRAGVAVRHTVSGNPAYAEITLRGYGETGHGRTLVLVDGERLNQPDMAAPQLFRVPLGAVRQVEVLHGPQSVLHGDNAVAGVVNIVTDAADYARETTVEAHGGSWDTWGARAATRGGDEADGIRYWAHAGADHSAGYRDHSSYDFWTGGGGVRKDWANGSWLRVSTFYTHADFDLPGSLTKAQWHRDPRASYNHGDRAGLVTYGLNTALNVQLNDEHALKTTFTASQKTSESRFDYPAYGYAWRSENDIYSYQLTEQYISTARLGSFDNEFTAGADIRWDTLRGWSGNDYRAAVGLRDTHSKYEYQRFIPGVFLRDEFFLTDELSFVAGGRYERNQTRNSQTTRTNRGDDNAAFEAGLNWRPLEDMKNYVRFSRFYRNPFLDEVGYVRYTPHNVVSPEHGWCVDVGTDWTFEKEFSVGADLFAQQTEREIFYDPFTYSNRNAPDTVCREGLDLHAGWNRDKVAGLNISYLLTFAEFDGGRYDGNKIPAVSRHQVSLRGNVYLWDECSVFGAYRFRGEQVSISDFANTADRLPSYSVFSAGVVYKPERFHLDGLQVVFSIDNLFDRDYCDYSTYGSAFYPAPGRTYNLSVAYTF